MWGTADPALISWLNANQTPAFAQLTTPAVGAVLPHVQRPMAHATGTTAIPHHAAGLTFAGVPTGLAVLRQQHQGPSPGLTVLSLAIAPQWRCLGLARQLMQWLRHEAWSLGWDRLSLSYPLANASTAAMERLTDPAEGWQHSPGLRLVQVERAGATELFEQLTPLVRFAQRSGRWALEPWGQLPLQLRHSVGAELEAPQWLWPCGDGVDDPLQTLDLTISTLLRDQGQPAGWLTAHRIGPSQCRVSQWWVHPRLQGSGAAVLLMHRALEAGLPVAQGYTVASFGMDPSNTAAIRLCEQKLEPLATTVCRQRRALITAASDHFKAATRF